MDSCSQELLGFHPFLAASLSPAASARFVADWHHPPSLIPYVREQELSVS